jgi:hypothetical protein
MLKTDLEEKDEYLYILIIVLIKKNTFKNNIIKQNWPLILFSIFHKISLEPFEQITSKRKENP